MVVPLFVETADPVTHSSDVIDLAISSPEDKRVTLVLDATGRPLWKAVVQHITSATEVQAAPPAPINADVGVTFVTGLWCGLSRSLNPPE